MTSNPFVQDKSTDIIVSVSGGTLLHLNSLILETICTIESINKLFDGCTKRRRNLLRISDSDSDDESEVSNPKKKKLESQEGGSSASKPIVSALVKNTKRKITLEDYDAEDVLHFFKLIYPGYDTELRSRYLPLPKILLHLKSICNKKSGFVFMKFNKS